MELIGKAKQARGMLHRVANSPSEWLRQRRKRHVRIYWNLKHYAGKFLCSLTGAASRLLARGAFHQNSRHVMPCYRRAMYPCGIARVPFQQPTVAVSIAHHFQFTATCPVEVFNDFAQWG